MILEHENTLLSDLECTQRIVRGAIESSQTEKQVDRKLREWQNEIKPRSLIVSAEDCNFKTELPQQTDLTSHVTWRERQTKLEASLS